MRSSTRQICRPKYLDDYIVYVGVVLVLNAEMCVDGISKTMAREATVETLLAIMNKEELFTSQMQVMHEVPATEEEPCN